MTLTHLHTELSRVFPRTFGKHGGLWCTQLDNIKTLASQTRTISINFPMTPYIILLNRLKSLWNNRPCVSECGAMFMNHFKLSFQIISSSPNSNSQNSSQLKMTRTRIPNQEDFSLEENTKLLQRSKTSTKTFLSIFQKNKCLTISNELD